ncbi:hypothetical protein K3495_g4835 [Podosphaera aphanis]|nr:hypothetical protein K3495_g4835 [Podosphaera aphanis]
MEVPHCFKIYKEKKERQTGKRIKALRFDGGSEYKTINFDGITQQVSAPYTQHQNGISERLNRSLVTMARCMLFHARLPLRFWDAAILTACYLRNRLPISRGKLTPYEGCICYALIDSEDSRRYKLSPTSNKGIFIGYCESSTQYRVYIPSKPGSNKNIISANVRFLESSFWEWDRSSSEILDNLDKSSQVHPIVLDSNSDSSTPSTPGQLDPTNPGVSEPVEYLETEIREENTLNLPEQADVPENTALEENILESSEYTAKSPPQLRRSNRIRKPIEPRSAWQPLPHFKAKTLCSQIFNTR